MMCGQVGDKISKNSCHLCVPWMLNVMINKFMLYIMNGGTYFSG